MIKIQDVYHLFQNLVKEDFATEYGGINVKNHVGNALSFVMIRLLEASYQTSLQY